MKITAKKKPMRETEDLIKIEVKQCWKAKGLDWAVDWGGRKRLFSLRDMAEYMYAVHRDCKRTTEKTHSALLPLSRRLLSLSLKIIEPIPNRGFQQHG